MKVTVTSTPKKRTTRTKKLTTSTLKVEWSLPKWKSISSRCTLCLYSFIGRIYTNDEKEVNIFLIITIMEILLYNLLLYLKYLHKNAILLFTFLFTLSGGTFLLPIHAWLLVSWNKSSFLLFPLRFALLDFLVYESPSGWWLMVI